MSSGAANTELKGLSMSGARYGGRREDGREEEKLERRGGVRKGEKEEEGETVTRKQIEKMFHKIDLKEVNSSTFLGHNN